MPESLALGDSNGKKRPRKKEDGLKTGRNNYTGGKTLPNLRFLFLLNEEEEKEEEKEKTAPVSRTQAKA